VVSQELAMYIELESRWHIL